MTITRKARPALPAPYAIKTTPECFAQPAIDSLATAFTYEMRKPHIATDYEPRTGTYAYSFPCYSEIPCHTGSNSDQRHEVITLPITERINAELHVYGSPTAYASEHRIYAVYAIHETHTRAYYNNSMHTFSHLPIAFLHFPVGNPGKSLLDTIAQHIVAQMAKNEPRLANLQAKIEWVASWHYNTAAETIYVTDRHERIIHTQMASPDTIASFPYMAQRSHEPCYCDCNICHIVNS